MHKIELDTQYAELRVGMGSVGDRGAVGEVFQRKALRIIIGSSFLYLIGTDSNIFFLMAE